MAEERFTIAGPAGELECVMATPADWQTGAPLAICCHPHPLHGGTLQNKVVHILAKSLAELGAKVVRFNFRGAGQSQGQFDHGLGEQQDLLAVAEHLRMTADNSPLWLAGFSFGAYVALAAHQQLQPERLALVALPVDMYPAIKSIQVATQDWLLVQGGKDEVVDADAVRQWAQGQGLPPYWIWLEEAGHFFHGRLTHIQTQIHQHWA
jgi:alpha/beta superfamily hydrolase